MHLKVPSRDGVHTDALLDVPILLASPCFWEANTFPYFITRVDNQGGNQKGHATTKRTG